MTSVDGQTIDPGVAERQLRQALLDRIWLGVLVIVIIGVPASVSRALATGWLHLYTFHVAMGALVGLIHVFRRRLSYKQRSIILLAMFFLIGAVGVMNMGLLGAGLWWLVVCASMTGTLLSRRAGFWVSAASLGIVASAGYLFTSRIIEYPVDVNRYVVDPTSWFSFLMAASLLPFMVFHSISIFQRSTNELLRLVSEQRDAIERLATHDNLTGLPLLNLAKDRLDVAIGAASRSGRKVAVMFLDLDGFKAINDALGHEAGDHVLVEVARRLQRVLRTEDTAARIGGDEFILILSAVETEKEPALVAARIIEEVARPILFADSPLTVGASVGVALYPDHATDPVTLRRVADEAMYSVKRSGKNRFAFAKSG